MFDQLLRPWRTARTWHTLVHTVLDVPVGVLAFIPTFTLLVTTVALAIVLPLALIPLLLLLVAARLIARLERSRHRALLHLDLPDPVAPLPSGSPWRRFKAAVSNRARWKEVGYALLRLPLGVVLHVVVVGAWCGSLALVLLPFYAGGLPQDTAQFWLFGVTQGPATIPVALLGMVGLVLGAPWLTVAAGWVDGAVARQLLAPSADTELAAKVVRAETGRAAAIDAAEAERRRIERDLHDGAQQRLVALAMGLGAARQRLDTDPDGAKALVAEAHEEAKAALKEIRDLVRGIHPVILEDRGLDAALSAVVARTPIPVDLSVEVPGRLPASVESTAYFVVSEALTNVARHAGASRARVAIVQAGDRLVIEVRDDGTGGADPTEGTGLNGLADRVVSLGGTMDLLSPVGGPTTVLVELPCAS